jgi:anti-sigma factor RsiW
MTCREARDRLSDYLDNDLAPAARRELEDHLRACAACCEEHRLLAATCRLLSTHGPAHCPVDFTRLAIRMPAPAWRRWTFLSLRTVMATATAVVAVVVAVGQWQRPEPSPPSESGPRVIVRDVAEVEELHRSFAVQQSLDARASLVLYAPEWAERGR